MEFELARNTVRYAEQLVIKTRRPREGNDSVAVYLDTLLVGPWLVMAGIDMLGRRFRLVLFVATVLLLFFWIVARGISWQPVAPALGMAVGIVYFGLPSRTVTAGVTEENIRSLCSYILDAAPNVTRLERLQAGTSLLRSQITDRLGRINVVIGICWAALFGYASAHVLAPGLAPSILGNGILFTGIAGIFFAGLLGIAISHTTAVRAVYLTLDFALLEAKAAIFNSQQFIETSAGTRNA
ncbi:hypothetical protein EKH79_14065 [Dyella dinghuensis]|uniref:Uncharacterized protein n=1 Tax=Dyella dinghuensis TaxID=1920169 RepID=A0A3S0QVK0_9GAMM|nr:hypothetical protein [Dyella dinghuensis]RUL62036.1 hypothetical protein EKH79_14065 [Dyella dinghuensis]